MKSATVVHELPIGLIDISEFNTRKDLTAGEDEGGVSELAASIEKRGLLSPITVFLKADGRYDLVAGQRRLLACQRLGWSTIAALVRDHMESVDATAVSLVENLQRADMNPRDKARAMKALLSEVGQEKVVSRETGLSSQTVRKYLRLLDLAPELQEQLAAGEARNTQALADLATKFSDPEDQKLVFGELRGFTQPVQQEMIKHLEPDLSNLVDIVNQAHEGTFGHKLIRNCPFDCPSIPPSIKQEVYRLIETTRSLA
jgi:ParB family chromosome partitioning protein